MATILNQPDEVVAVLHEEHEVVCCIACSKDFREKHKHLDGELTRVEMIAKNVHISDKCDVCFGNLLETLF